MFRPVVDVVLRRDDGMLLWISIIFLVLGTALWALAEHFTWWTVENAGKIITGFTALVVLIELMVLIYMHIDIYSQVAADRQKFESLYYQYKIVMHDTEYTLGHYKLMNDIKEWNSCLAWHQSAEHDIWIGPFVPDVYDSYEYITIDKFLNEVR